MDILSLDQSSSALPISNPISSGEKILRSLIGMIVENPVNQLYPDLTRYGQWQYIPSCRDLICLAIPDPNVMSRTRVKYSSKFESSTSIPDPPAYLSAIIADQGQLAYLELNTVPWNSKVQRQIPKLSTTNSQRTQFIVPSFRTQWERFNLFPSV